MAEAIGVKIANKHSVYESDLNDAFGDPFMIVMRSKRKSPPVKDKIESQGRVYELLCATESRRILFIVGRLFPSGGFYIITAYWAKGCLAQLYYRESEVFREHDEDEEKYCKSGENP